ncbi:PTS transporter subunit EIIB, partial [Pseudomonas sp. JAI120]|uniref:PTS transporter subunit EIIB n=1 Tax=Pseudomonas sp. JAI120 TaxID=2723063 RepID=UPI0030EF62C6
DDAALKALGARGIIRPSATALQVVLGPIADVVSVEIRDALALGGGAVTAPVAATPTAEPTLTLAAPLLAALGGADNIADSARYFGRLRITLRDVAKADQAALDALNLHAVARPAPGLLHLLGDETTIGRLITA